MRALARRLAWGACTACALGGAMATAGPACMGHDCEPSMAPRTYGTHLGEGNFLDDSTWESTPLGGVWLDFGGARTIPIEIPRWEAEGRPIIELHGYVSYGSQPNFIPPCDQNSCAAPDNWTEGTGSLLEFRHVAPGQVWVTNGTCTHFYVRVVLRAGPPASIADGGAIGTP